MSALTKLLVALGLDSSGYHKGLDDAERKAETSTKSIKDRLEKLGSGMTSLGIKMSAAVTLPIVGGMGFAMKSASDLNETVSKVGVVFEDAAGQVFDFARTAATDLGMTREAALAAAGTYGNLFTAMGITEKSAAGMSTGLVQLAADLASFNNMNPTEVMDALRAGLSGETEPLKRLGVNISAVAVAQKAMALGLVREGEELTVAAKAQATYALILEQTTKAQGDFARTSDGMANQTRIARAQMGDLAASFGDRLLPIGLKVLTWLNGLLTGFQALSPHTQNIILIVGVIIAAIGPLLIVLGQVVTAVGAISGVFTGLATVAIGPVLLGIAAVIAIFALLYLAWKNNFGGIQTVVRNFWNQNLRPIFDAIVTWLKTNIPLAIEKLRTFWEEVLLPALQKAWAWIHKYLLPLFGALANFLGAVLGVAIRAAVGFWEKVLLPALEKVWKFIEEKILPVFKKVFDWLGEKLKPAFHAITEGIKMLTEWLNRMADRLKNLKLPSWLTPGSPTPLELGLLGINREMAKLSGSELPAFSSQLRLSPVVVGSVPGVQGITPSRPISVSLNYQPFISLADQYEAQEKLVPYVERALRGIR